MIAARAARFGRLRTVARGSQVVFGSAVHGWKTAPPLSDADVKRLEKSLGVTLPDDAKAWWTSVASSGAGPFYGLLPLAKKRGSDPTKPFSGKKSKVLDGCVAVADEGAGDLAVLVLSGRQRGSVWTVLSDGQRALLAPSFDVFIDEWLTRATVEWAESRLFEALKNRTDPVAAILEDLRALPLEGEPASEGRLQVAMLLRAAAGDFTAASALADRAAAAFIDENADRSEPDELEDEACERKARRCLYRARVFQLQGKRKASIDEAKAGLAIAPIWASTEEELEALAH